jgi:dGTPase
LKLEYSQFELLTDKENLSIKSIQNEKLDLQLRIYNRLSPRSINCYKKGMEYKENYKELLKIDEKTVEWWLRVHMIIDHISGMTDSYALETYKMFEGML